jgi:myo-inositol 2-dehydrogenase/D-chiro-inositol 1-dehydrogenase
VSAALRIGLAGLGAHGSRYARHLLAGDVPGAQLTVVCRSDEKKGQAFASDHGLAFVAHAEDLAAHPEVDAVVISLPPCHHPRVATACLENQRPVLVEKPMAPDAASARSVVECVERTGTPLMVGQTLRLDTVIRRLRDEREGLGPLRTLYINQRFEPADRSWIDTPGCGGLFLNTGIHGFDLLRWLTGAEPISVYAEAGRAITRDTEDQFAAIVRMEPGGIIAVVDNARSSRSRSGRIELIGESAQIWGDHIHRTLVRVSGRDTTDLGPVEDAPTVPLLLNRFVTALACSVAPEITARDGLAAVELVEAATLSAREGRRVTIEEVRNGSERNRPGA